MRDTEKQTSGLRFDHKHLKIESAYRQVKTDVPIGLDVSPFYIRRGIPYGIIIQVGTTDRRHYGGWTLGVALTHFELQARRDPGIRVAAKVDIVFPHQVFILSQSGEQVLVGRPPTRSMWRGGLV